jgi:hypothetical protein
MGGEVGWAGWAWGWCWCWWGSDWDVESSWLEICGHRGGGQNYKGNVELNGCASEQVGS